MTVDSSKPDYIREFKPVRDVAREMTSHLRQRGAEVVVALTHLPMEQDKALLGALGDDGPDLIIGGHDHAQDVQ
jgi:2',3'-cyclic-nucleotide 2'-phosphodiesterase (5'-nucleotidase family)